MPCDGCPEDDDCRQTYNFPPGAIGLVYRADVPDYGAGPRKDNHDHNQAEDEVDEAVHDIKEDLSVQEPQETHYKLQAMKWGLIPSWTKRNPDYGSVMKTINCRDDSLIENRGMWNTMKRRKRCIVICQGFYEWLTKGKEKVPHFTRRKDCQLMCFAGLWDCVKYEGKRLKFSLTKCIAKQFLPGSDDKHYTYSIITTDSNSQLKFLHNRMPVIFDNGSKEIRTWLDPNRYEWTKELQSLLKPYTGELECYPVNKDVGKVGNNSPSFIIPVNSAENKSNIANFFDNQKKLAKGQGPKKSVAKAEDDVESKGIKVEREVGETRTTIDSRSSENNAPLPISPRGIKRERSDQSEVVGKPASPEHKLLKTVEKSPRSSASSAPSARKMKSATSNGTKASPSKPPAGTQRITKFFGK